MLYPVRQLRTYTHIHIRSKTKVNTTLNDTNFDKQKMINMNKKKTKVTDNIYSIMTFPRANYFQ